MTSIPSDAWFCEQCQLRGVAQSRQAREEQEEMVMEQSAPRGRGRPSGKLRSDTMTSFGTGGNSSSLRPVASTSSLPRLKNAGLLRSTSGASIGVFAVSEPDVVNVQTVLDFIQAKTDPSFTPAEKAILEQLRRWAPVCDLKIIFETLARKNSEFSTT